MTINHLKWERNGRTFIDSNKPNQRVWKTSNTDDRNVDNGNGTFSPYIFDPDTYTLKHGESAIEFATGEQVITNSGKTLVSQSKIFVNVNFDDGNGWIDAPHGLPTKSIDLQDEYAQAKNDFLDAEINGIKYELSVTTRVKSGNRGTIGIHFKMPVACQVRFEIVNSGIDTVDYEWQISKLAPEKNQSGVWEQFVTGCKFKDVAWNWSINESLTRVSEVVDDTFRITLGDYNVAANEEFIIYPDTWGAVSIDDGNDDCQEQGSVVELTGQDSDGDIVGERSGYSYLTANRFDGIPADLASAVSIDAGTKIEPYLKWQGASTDILVYGIKEDNPLNWASGTNPSGRTWTTANVSHTVPNNTPNGRYASFPDINTLLEEIRADQTWVTGGAIALVFEDDNNAVNIRLQFGDYDRTSTQVSELTVVYTVGGSSAGNPWYYYAQQ